MHQDSAVYMGTLVMCNCHTGFQLLAKHTAATMTVHGRSASAIHCSIRTSRPRGRLHYGRQPMTFNESKSCCQGHRTVSESLAGGSIHRTGKRHATCSLNSCLSQEHFYSCWKTNSERHNSNIMYRIMLTYVPKISIPMSLNTIYK